MTTPRCTLLDYIDFLLATPRVYSLLEAARVQPPHPFAPAHDAFTRLLQRLEPDPTTLWNEVAPLLERKQGVLVLDDSTLDKPYAQKIALVNHHWSGKHHAVVNGINLISVVWTDGDRLYPVDYRLYDRTGDGLTKNDHFRNMLDTAFARGFQPSCVLFDGWYAGLDNLKKVREHHWTFLTRLKSNRLVNQDRTKNRPLATWPIAATGTVVHLSGFGLVKVFRIIGRDGEVEHWATNDLTMAELARLAFAEQSWAVEEYHRGIKQFCGVERCQVRSAKGQRNHVGSSLQAFVRLEYHRFTTGVSWFAAKWEIIRGAVRAYLAHPLYKLPSAA
jgi:putative transposase